MIYQIDILQSDAVEDDISRWGANAQSAEQAPGFVESTLHKVFRRINQQGYELVSITNWLEVGSYNQIADGDASSEDNHFGAGRRALYALVNQGGDLSASAEGNLIVTNPYRIDKASAPRHAEMWNQSKRHMETKDGFVNARLFQTLDADAEYFFVSRAEWRSEELFMCQFGGQDFKQIVAPFESMFSICFSRVIARVGKQSAH